MKKCFFLPFFAQKKHMRKRSIFWQKPWTNPFAKCRFFSTLWEVHFWGPKRLSSIQNIKKCFFLAFFAQKKHIRKRFIFWEKPWTNPFAKCRFPLTLLEFHFASLKSILYYREYPKLFLSGFFCSKETYEKKVDFLTKTMD